MAYPWATLSWEAPPRSGAQRLRPVGWADTCDIRGLSHRVDASLLLRCSPQQCM